MLRSVRLATIVLLIGSVAAAQPTAKVQPTVWAEKPNAAAFEKIVNDRLAAGQASIDQLVAVKGARTIENTLVPYDEAIRQLNAGTYLANLMFQVHPDATFRDLATKLVQKGTAAFTALSLNGDVYKALASLDLSKADAATKYYVKRQLLQFRLAGVDKDEATRTRLKQLNDDLTLQVSTYERNIADDQRSIKISSAAELDGLPQDYIDRHKPGADGKITITTDYPDVFPVLKFGKSTSLRQRLYEQFDDRAYPKNRDLLMKMMQTRYEIATLLGYSPGPTTTRPTRWRSTDRTLQISFAISIPQRARSRTGSSPYCLLRNANLNPTQSKSGNTSPATFANSCADLSTISIRSRFVRICPTTT